MRRPYIILLTGISLMAIPTVSADILEQFRKRSMEELSGFRDASKDNLEKFRRSVNEDIARFMSDPWTPVEPAPALEPPVDPSPPPIYIDCDTVELPDPQPVIIREIIEIPEPTPQPEPLEPIIEISPIPDEPEPDTDPEINKEPVIKADNLEFSLYGTGFAVRKPDLSGYRLTGDSPAGYADAWRSLNNSSTNNLILDCLAQREEKALCDWAYLQMILTLSRQLYPENEAKATMLAGFLLCQSGYRIRFATDSRRQLQLLYSPAGFVYDVPSFVVDGYSYYLATGSNGCEGTYEMCNFTCPGEQQLNFEITRAMRLDYAAAPTRHIEVHNNPEITADVTTNRNLIEFYNTYPIASIGSDTYSIWAIYANTPASPELRRDLYPVLREAVKGKTQQEAANLLIHLAESFPYGYDSEIWGYDRAFFTDESWHYPYSDCEDHAIHFTRLVRDILDLEAVLIYYPGHLASAVAFTDQEIPGDYVLHRGKRFTICDPTIFYANIGTTMPGCDNSSAVLIDLH